MSVYLPTTDHKKSTLIPERRARIIDFMQSSQCIIMVFRGITNSIKGALITSAFIAVKCFREIRPQPTKAILIFDIEEEVRENR